MKSNFLYPKEKFDYNQNDVFVGKRYQRVQNSNSSHTSFSVPSSPISNKHPKRKNKLLDRIRSQLIDIKSQVFKISNHHGTSTKQIDRLQKFSNKQYVNNQNNTYNVLKYLKSNSNYDCNFVQTNSRYPLQNEKFQLTSQKHKQQIFFMTQTLIGLQKQLFEKDRKLQEYEEQIYQELQKFKQQVVSYNDRQNLTSHINELQQTIQNMNEQIIYLRKRTEDYMLQIKKLTIDNHQLANPKQEETIKDNIKQDEVKKVNILSHFRQPSQQSLDSFGIDEFFKLKDCNKQMSQQIILQQNTIRVLQSQLEKGQKQTKNIQRTNQTQQLNNVKMTYEKLLNQVKQGLVQCYQSQIQDLKIRLSKYTQIQNIDSKNSSIIPLQKKKSKIVTETISEIIIVEQDQQYEVTSRKAVTPNSQMISVSITERQDLKNKVQQQQKTIKQLQQYIEHLKTSLQYSQVQSGNQLGSLISKNNSANKLNFASQQKQQTFYESMIKQYTTNLQSSLLSNLFQSQFTNIQSLESISSQMQFVIEKLKIRNYEIQKKLKQTEDILNNKNVLIDELKRHLFQIKQRQSDQVEANQRAQIKIQRLKEENRRLQSFYDSQKQRSDTKLKDANQQIQQLKGYKMQLQKQITKRQQRIRILKQQINEIIKQQDRKRKNMIISHNKSFEKKDNVNLQLQIQSKYFNTIIEDLTCQLYELKHSNNINNRNGVWKENQIKQLKARVLKKEQQILTLKNKEASFRLYSDKFKSQQQLQKIDWATSKNNNEIKLQKQVQLLIKQLSCSKEIIQNLQNQINKVRKQLQNNVQFYKTTQLNTVQNIPLQSLLKSSKSSFKQKDNINSLIVELLNKPNKLVKKQLNKSTLKENIYL